MAWLDWLCQWLGFLGIVVGTYRYGSDRFTGALFCALGSAFLSAWVVLQTPLPWGVLLVQVMVGVLSVRNMILGWRGA